MKKYATQQNLYKILGCIPKPKVSTTLENRQSNFYNSKKEI